MSQTTYIKFNYPEWGELNENTINRCFTIGLYPDDFTALTAYAETPCSWSTLLNDNESYDDFIEEAKKHILDNDIEWLEENFT